MWLDNMIEYMNKHHSDKYILKYSTPSEYISSINYAETLSIKTNDMFPYSDTVQAYWTGYYTSRPNLKF